MPETSATPDALEELELALAFAEACAHVLDLRALLARAGACLMQEIQADAAAVVLDAAPVAHYTSRRPLGPEAERSLREAAGDAALVRDADLDAPWEGAGDGPLFVIAERALEGGRLLVLSRIDWILSPRTEARLDRRAATLGRALAQAREVARLREGEAPLGAVAR
jgi:hypothetical protein